MAFDRNAPEYRCRICCCRPHAKVLTTIFVVLELLGTASSFGKMLASLVISIFSEHPAVFGVVLGSVIVLAIPLLILLLAAWGLSKEKHSFLIPFIVVQFISLIFVITFFIASIAAVVMTNVITPPTPSPQSDVFLHGPNRTAIINLPGFEGLGENFPSFDRDEEQSFISGAWTFLKAFAVAALVASTIALLLKIWTVVVVMRCYRCFRDQAASPALDVLYQPVPAQPAYAPPPPPGYDQKPPY